jgi:hypothetical protein
MMLFHELNLTQSVPDEAQLQVRIADEPECPMLAATLVYSMQIKHTTARCSKTFLLGGRREGIAHFLFKVRTRIERVSASTFRLYVSAGYGRFLILHWKAFFSSLLLSWGCTATTSQHSPATSQHMQSMTSQIQRSLTEGWTFSIHNTVLQT